MTISSKEDIALMCQVGKLVGLTIREMKAAAKPGMTTAELDRIGADFLRRNGARSAPREAYNFPGFTCLSLNEEVVHGIPGPRRMKPGDVLKIDVTAELGGYVADAAITVVLPPAAPQARKLRKCAEAAFERRWEWPEWATASRRSAAPWTPRCAATASACFATWPVME